VGNFELEGEASRQTPGTTGVGFSVAGGEGGMG